MVTTFFPPHNFGGDGMWVYRLTNSLARQGHRLSVVYNPHAFKLMGGAISGQSFPLHANVETFPLGPPRLGLAGTLLDHQLGQPFAHRPELERFFAGNEFDVVHFHNISLLGGPRILELGRGIKFCTLNDHWFVCAMHILWRFDREACQKRTCLACTLAGRRPPQLWRYTGTLDRALEQVDMFIAPSLSAVQTHRSNGFSRPIRALPYFLPATEADSPVEDSREDPPRRPYFLFVGRLEKMKGVQDLIEVFRTYRSAELVIAGIGAYENTLRQLAAGLEHVRFTGLQSDRQLRNWYRGALATVVPSIGYETFGWPTLESFAQRTPVIVRAIGPLPEIAAGGGLVFSTQAELEAALSSLQGSPELRERLGEQGFRNYQSRYTEAVHIDRYHELVAEIRAQREAGS